MEASIKTVFYATPKGVFNRLATLTSFQKSTETMKIDELCPMHSKVMQVLGLIKVELPVLK